MGPSGEEAEWQGKKQNGREKGGRGIKREVGRRASEKRGEGQQYQTGLDHVAALDSERKGLLYRDARELN